MASVELPTYESLKLRVGDGEYKHVYEVRLNRPAHRNAFHELFWQEFHSCIRFLDSLPPCRCILLTADGPVFSAGIDLAFAATLLQSPLDFVRSSFNHAQQTGRRGETASQKSSADSAKTGAAGEEDSRPESSPEDEDCARKALYLQRCIRRMQDTFTVLEECSKPVIVCVTGACIGGAVALICACDIRLATQDSWFTVKEVDLGLAADLGTLQRLPRAVGNDSWAREVCFTGRTFHAAEAKRVGFLSEVFANKGALLQHAWALAATIAAKSPVAVVGTKHALNYAVRRSLSEELKLQSVWNCAMLQTKDIPVALDVGMRRKQESDWNSRSSGRGQIFSNL